MQPPQIMLPPLTPDQKGQLAAWRSQWAEMGSSTEPADFAAATEAVHAAYAISGRPPPVVLHMESPYTAMLGLLLVQGYVNSGLSAEDTEWLLQSGILSAAAQRKAVPWKKILDATVSGQRISQSLIQARLWSPLWTAVWRHCDPLTMHEIKVHVEAPLYRLQNDFYPSRGPFLLPEQLKARLIEHTVTRFLPQANKKNRKAAMAALDKVADMLPSFQHSLLSLSGCASIGFLRDVMGWRHPALKHCAVTESLSKNRLDVWCHENVVALSTRPEFIQRDERGRLHCSHGPSVRYRDGVMLYHWHGVEVPAAVVERPQDITVRQIEDEPNFEIRRVMVERYELARYIVDSGATVVHELPADHPLPGLRTARLLRRAARWRAPISFEDELERIEYELAQEDEDELTGEVRTGEPIFYVDLLNSTPEPDGSVKRYVLRVDPKAYGGEAARNVHAAAASTWRNADGSLTYEDWRDYAPGFES